MAQREVAEDDVLFGVAQGDDGGDAGNDLQAFQVEPLDAVIQDALGFARCLIALWRFDRADEDVARPQPLNLLHRRLLGAFTDGHHDDHRGDAKG